MWQHLEQGNIKLLSPVLFIKHSSKLCFCSGKLAPFALHRMIYSTLFQQCNLVSLDLTAPACHHFAATIGLFGEVKPDHRYREIRKDAS